MKSIIKTLTIISRIYEKAIFLAAEIAAVAIFITMITTMSDNITRWLKIPILGIYELNALLVGAAIYLALAITQNENKNISASFIKSFLPNTVSGALQIILGAMCATFFGWLAYLLFNAARSAYVGKLVAEGISRFPLWPLKTVMFIGITLLTIQLIIDVVCSIRKLIAPKFQKETPV